MDIIESKLQAENCWEAIIMIYDLESSFLDKIHNKS